VSSAADFSAHCPNCAGRRWKEPAYTGALGEQDSVICVACGYRHYLRGPENAPVQQLEKDLIADLAENSLRAKRARIRALVIAMCYGGYDASPDYIVDRARQIDAIIEAQT
jgi:hypothetical protein